MLILQDYDAEVVIARLHELEKRTKKYRDDKDERGLTLAESLEQKFSHSRGKEF